jgi:hypothetical protein
VALRAARLFCRSNVASALGRAAGRRPSDTADWRLDPGQRRAAVTGWQLRRRRLPTPSLGLRMMSAAISKYPARLPTPAERALVLEWLAAAGDVTLAYVGSRGSDEAAIKDRIVVYANGADDPSHLVHAAAGRDIWMVFALGRRTKTRRFRTLRAALNSIRPVLVEAERFDLPYNFSLN